MPTLAPHKWNSDHPETHPDNEVLDRKDFAARLAKEIRGWQRMKSSLVLGLNGEWGCGKTTLAFLVEFYLKEQAKEEQETEPIIVRFNPWQWSGQELLSRAFFDEIAAGLRGTKAKKKSRYKELARLVEGLKIATLAIRDVATQLQESLTALAALLASGAAGALAANLNTTSPKWGLVLSWTGLVLLGVATVCAVLAPVAERIAEWLGFMARKPKHSLEQIRMLLKERFTGLNECMLVVIDDVDRLTKQQVRMLMQLVKVNADFPNVVYLLLYQKDIVACALDDEAPGHGQDFLKKIVQVELEVPDAPEHRMLELFRKNVHPIFFRDRRHLDEDRWSALFEEGVWPNFRTPRDIKRFAGVFAFYYESHVVDGELDVNPIDLILLETLRLFDPPAYEAVGRAFQRQRSIILELLYGDKEAKSRLALGVQALLDRKEVAENEPRKKQLGTLLYSLFPQAQDSFEVSAERELEWNRDLRICHPQHFAKYFQISRDPSDVSAAFISRLFAAGSSRDQLRALLKQAFDKGSFLGLMDRLYAVRKDVPQSMVGPFVTALFDLSDELPEPEGEPFSSESPERALARVVLMLLERIENREERGEALRNAVCATSAISVPAMCVSALHPSKDKPAGETGLPVDLAVLQGLQKELRPRLTAVAQNGAIWKLRKASYLIYRHRDWIGEKVTRAWLAEALREPQIAIEFLKVMLAEAQVTGGRGSRAVYTLQGTELESFVDLQELARSVAKQPMQEGDDLGKAAVQALGKAIKRKLEERSYEKIYVLSRDSHGRWVHDPEDGRF